MYEYAATVLRIYDGDTLEASIDLGFRLSFRTMVRLTGVDTPELPTPDGARAKQALADMVQQTQQHVVLKTTLNHEFEKFGRVLAEVYATVEPNRPSMNERLIRGGFAKPYTGGPRGIHDAHDQN